MIAVCWANSILALRYAWIHSPLQEVRDSMSTSEETFGVESCEYVIKLLYIYYVV